MMTPCCTLVNFTNDSLDWLLELCLGSSYDKWVEVLLLVSKMNTILSISRNQYLCTGENLSSLGTLRPSTTRPLSASKSNRWFSPLSFIVLIVYFVNVQQNETLKKTKLYEDVYCVAPHQYNMQAGIKRDLLIMQYFKKSFRICGSQSIKKYISN